MKSLEERIAIETAALNGVPIEVRGLNSSSWVPIHNLAFVGADWTQFEYRIALSSPNCEPQMPDAPVWWVREKGKENYHTLVCSVNNSLGVFLLVPSKWIGLQVAAESCHWSPDRKTWFDFYGNKVEDAK